MKVRTPKAANQGGARGVSDAEGREQKLCEPTSKRRGEWPVSTHSGRNLNPALKIWVDHVIVPALIEEWIK
jgi:hypothetical protein